MRTLQELRDVKFRDMSKEEQRAVVDAAVGKLKTELESPVVQKAIAEILNDDSAKPSGVR